ncbi:fasciclin domain-containing protein, partial [Facklamia sp. P13055]|uniref:fasciclin domain-containing protein n=2 Tax=Facklamia TaxID=66831 RepID=UPI003D16FCFC
SKEESTKEISSKEESTKEISSKKESSKEESTKEISSKEDIHKQKDIVATLQDNDDFSILAAAFEKTNLVEILQENEPYTLFAPTDEAFEQLLEELDITEQELLTQPDLNKLLTYHLVASKILAEDLKDGKSVETVNGEKVAFDFSEDEPMISESMITSTDLEVSNGVIHIIDTVLIPKDFELQKMDTK